MTGIPYVALLAGLFVQTMVTMGAYSVPAAAPAIAADLGVPGERVGVFISMVYGMGMVSAVFSVSFIHRFGAVRVSQFILLAGIGLCLAASLGGTVAALGLGAILLGFGYGATAPTSSHLLMKRTPPKIRNLVFSIRQIGVPLGGVMAGFIVPPLVLAFDWQTAMAVQVIPAVLMLLWLQTIRATYDDDRNPTLAISARGLVGPVGLLKTMPEMRAMALMGFFYAGVQLCFVSFTSVHLFNQAGFDLVAAGAMLASYQISGVVSRPIWGVIADRWIPARLMLVAMGFTMAAMAVLAGTYSADWPWLGIFAVSIVAGATASGYTGLAFAEYARIGGTENAAASTALGASAQFFGVMILPTIFSVMVSTGGYALAYDMVAAMAVFAGVSLWIFGRSQPRG
jgi:MFS family permease